MTDKIDTLYQYYQQQSILPTFASLGSAESLRAMERGRRLLFRDKLHLPVALFRQAAVLEFGPDSGEHAMVLAEWGADLTLVEPNPRAHGEIQRYFSQEPYRQKLQGLVCEDVFGFQSDRQYDFICAEGFIYTVKPTTRWMEKFHGLLAPEGLCLISYYERFGGLLELVLRAIFSAVLRLRNGDAMDTAKLLYQPKWDSIPHSRTFESWVMDVLQNPFVRAETFLAADELLEQADSVGFDLYSSWPVYEDTLTPYWHKKNLASDEKLAARREHIARSALSFVCGQRAYWTGIDSNCVQRQLDTLVKAVDAVLDGGEGQSAEQVATAFAALADLVADRECHFSDSQQREAWQRLARGLAKVFLDLASGDVEQVITYCRQNTDFITAWGLPCHFAVLLKRPDRNGS